MTSDEEYNTTTANGRLYISREQFAHVQELTKRNARSSPSGRVYIFTSILKCAECSHNLVGRKIRDYYYYRCNQHYQRGRCTHSKEIREEIIEKWLFENLARELEQCKIDWEIKAAKKKRAASGADKAVLKKKLQKLKELYVNDLIDLEEYKKDYQIYTAALEQIQEPAAETPLTFLLPRQYWNLALKIYTIR